MRGLLLCEIADEWLFLAVVGVVRCNRARLTNNPSPIKKVCACWWSLPADQSRNTNKGERSLPPATALPEACARLGNSMQCMKFS
jgi:hypothetical protein